MANFEVSTRVDYRDVRGLVLDCRQGDFEVDALNRIQTWFNRAQPDPVTNGKFQNLLQLVDSLKPFRGLNGEAVFDGAQHFTGELRGTLGAAKRDWVMAIDIVKGTSSTPQAIMGSQDDSLRAFRLNGANYGYQTPAGFVAGSGEMDDGVNVFASDGTDVDWLENNVVDISGGAQDPSAFPADTVDAIYVGRTQGGGDGLRASLRSIRLWSRVLSPRELDLIHATIGQTDLSAGLVGVPRAQMSLADWTDETFDQSLRQVNRLNPQIGIPQKFVKATMPAGETATMVQFACEVEAEVKPDSRLGGDLFTVSVIEQPGTSAPGVNQDAGWSSVFDVTFQIEGHYTLLFERPSGGSVIVHIDVVVP